MQLIPRNLLGFLNRIRRRPRCVMKAVSFVILTAALILVPLGLSAQQVRAQRTHPISATMAGACNFAQRASSQGSDHGFDLANLDRGVKPCDDFVEFAMGGWLKNNPV